MTETCTINLRDITFDYSSISLNTVTLDPSTSSSGNSVTIDTNFDIIGWDKDRHIVEEYKEEQAIRERNIGVQTAWEQYKIMVALAKEPLENLDNLE